MRHRVSTASTSARVIPAYLNSCKANRSKTGTDSKSHAPRSMRIIFCIISLIMRSSRIVYVASICYEVICVCVFVCDGVVISLISGIGIWNCFWEWPGFLCKQKSGLCPKQYSIYKISRWNLGSSPVQSSVSKQLNLAGGNSFGYWRENRGLRHRGLNQRNRENQ